MSNNTTGDQPEPVKINDTDRPDWFLYENKIISFRRDLGNASDATLQDIDALGTAVYECKSRKLPVNQIIDSDNCVWLIEEYITREVNTLQVCKILDTCKSYFETISLHNIRSLLEVEIRLVTVDRLGKVTLTINGALGQPMEGSHPDFYVSRSYRSIERI